MLNRPMSPMVQAPTSRRKTAIDQIDRQVHGDESELEAAGEEAEHQQHVAAMTEGLAERLCDRLLRTRRRRGSGRRTGLGCRQRQRERQDEQHHAAEGDKRVLPAGRVDQHAGERREQELAERSGRGAETERERAPRFRQELAERADHDGEGAARQRKADEQAGAEIEQARRRRMRHEDETGRIGDRAGPQHAHRAITIRDRAGERLKGAPQQVLDRERPGEDVTAPSIGERHRVEELAGRRARPEAQHADHTAAGDDHDRGAPSHASLSGLHSGHENFRRFGGRRDVRSRPLVRTLDTASVDPAQTNLPHSMDLRASCMPAAWLPHGSGLAARSARCYMRFARSEDK